MRNVYIAVVALLIGAALGFYLKPTKVVTKLETVVKTVTVDHVDIVTEVHVIEKPDGTKDTTTIIKDKSVITGQTDSDTKIEKVVTTDKAQWRLNALIAPLQGLESPVAPLYGLEIQRRVLGPIWAGGFVNTSRVYGVTIGLEF